MRVRTFHFIRSRVYTSPEFAAFVNLVLAIEKHPLAAIWLAGMNWYFSAPNQSRPVKDLLFAVTNIRARFDSGFPTFKSAWINPPMSNGRWFKSTCFSELWRGLANNTLAPRISFEFFVAKVVTRNDLCRKFVASFFPFITNGTLPIPPIVNTLLLVASS